MSFKKLVPVSAVIVLAALLFAACSSSSDSGSELVSIQPSAVQNQQNQPPSQPSAPASDAASNDGSSSAGQPETSPPSSTNSPAQAPAAPQQSFPNNVLPEISVTQITGDSDADQRSVFRLDSVVDGTMPVLVWFWAPH